MKKIKKIIFVFLVLGFSVITIEASSYYLSTSKSFNTSHGTYEINSRVAWSNDTGYFQSPVDFTVLTKPSNTLFNSYSVKYTGYYIKSNYSVDTYYMGVWVGPLGATTHTDTLPITNNSGGPR